MGVPEVADMIAGGGIGVCDYGPMGGNGPVVFTGSDGIVLVVFPADILSLGPPFGLASGNPRTGPLLDLLAQPGVIPPRLLPMPPQISVPLPILPLPPQISIPLQITPAPNFCSSCIPPFGRPLPGSDR